MLTLSQIIQGFELNLQRAHFYITLPWKFKKLKEKEKLGGKWQDEVSVHGSVWAIHGSGTV